VTRDYDAIVVGARCAGSSTAMLLARRGYRVLLVDRTAFPSDTVSTHLIHAPGVAALQRWGLLDRVAATGCPPVQHFSFDFGPFTITGRPRPWSGVTTAYAPRRTLLDTILVEAAAAAGAEVRQRFTVDDVVVEDGRVLGIRGRADDGAAVSERARVVIGADGRNSRVVRAVEPEHYHDKGVLQWSYYTYWSGLPVDGMEITIRPDRGFGAFPTNDGLTVLVVGWPAAEGAAYKADVEANYLKTIELAPALAERVRAARREARFAGGPVDNYVRKPFGRGWALVGDAGYNKDPCTAQGISDAFRDAELCATALDEVFDGGRSFDDAMSAYQQARDAHALPMYEFTTQLATLEPPPPEVEQLLAAVAGNPDAMDAFASVYAGTMSPVEFFDPAHIESIMNGARDVAAAS
jgi:2-polyprenyl-6-methoxyphenol hydroxylase-like FAD-dependent oxidoreductase